MNTMIHCQIQQARDKERQEQAVKSFDSSTAAHPSSNDSSKVSGLATVWGAEYRLLGGLVHERIAEGAFYWNDQTVAYLAHDQARQLGAIRSGTLRLESTQAGLRFDLTLPDTNDGHTVKELVQRGDLQGMSWNMTEVKDEWDITSRPVRRTITSALITEISPVAQPASPQTQIAISDNRDKNGQYERRWASCNIE